MISGGMNNSLKIRIILQAKFGDNPYCVHEAYWQFNEIILKYGNRCLRHSKKATKMHCLLTFMGPLDK